MITRLIFFTMVFCLPFSAYAMQAGAVASSPSGICPILIGSELPPITLQDLAGNDVDLNKSVAAKPTVLIYFRGGW
jgi:hypothetical protein